MTAKTLAQLQSECALSGGSMRYIAVLGDSIMASNTKGFGNYPNINLAVPGATTEAIYQVQVPLLRSIMGPGLAGVIFSGGTNDVPLWMGGIGTGQASTTNLLNILNACLLAVNSVPTKVMALAPAPQTDPNTAMLFAALTATYGVLCAAKGVGYCPLASVLATGNPNVGVPQYFVDGTHFSAAGWDRVRATINGNGSNVFYW